MLEVIALIESHAGKYKRSIVEETRLEADLGITGDDAVDILLDFRKKFNVNLDHFNIDNYFYPEAHFLIIPSFHHTRELTVGMLRDAVLSGKLE